MRNCHLRSIVAALVLGSLGACAEGPVERVIAPSYAVGPADGFPVVQVRADFRGADRGPITADLATALERVRPGGTIRVHPGTYPVHNLQVRKSVTIEGVGRPILDAEGSASGIAFTNDVTGPVTLRGVELRGASEWLVIVDPLVPQVVLEESVLHGPNGHGNDELSYQSAFIALDVVGTIVVRNNRFVDGAIGVHANPVGEGSLTVAGNAFGRHSNAAVHLGGSGSGTVVVKDNTFNGCGPVWCVGAFTAGDITYERNTFTVDFASPTNVLIFMHARKATVRDNRITTTGGTLDPGAAATWPIRGPAIAFYQTPDGIVTDNEITRSFVGISFDQSTITGTDNRIRMVAAGFSGAGPGPTSHLRLNRNDVVEYAQAITGAYAYASADFTCNWWGSSSGPAGVDPILGPAVYQPFATAPIAGTGRSC